MPDNSLTWIDSVNFGRPGSPDIRVFYISLLSSPILIVSLTHSSYEAISLYTLVASSYLLLVVCF